MSEQKVYKDENGEFIFRYKNGHVIKIYLKNEPKPKLGWIDRERLKNAPEGLSKDEIWEWYWRGNVEKIEGDHTNQKIDALEKKPMKFREADSNNPNPKYLKKYNQLYTENCQTCVLAFEMRMRGYDVEAIPYYNEDLQSELAYDVGICWRNKGGSNIEDLFRAGIGEKPENIVSKEYADWLRKQEEMLDERTGSAEKVYKFIDNTVKAGERYVIAFGWTVNGGHTGHVVSLFRNDEGELVLYDPQDGSIMGRGEEVLYVMENHFLFRESDYFPGLNQLSSAQLYRVDDKLIKPEYLSLLIDKKTDKRVI